MNTEPRAKRKQAATADTAEGKIFFWFLVLSAACLGSILSALFSTPAGAQTESKPWRLEADRLKGDKTSQMVEAFGNVHIHRGEDYMQADYARYYPETKWAYLRGNVRAKWNQDFMQGKEAEFDLENKVGWVKDGRVFLAREHIYFKGKELKKTGAETYEFEEATVTACDGETPAWSLKTSSGSLTIDGYANLWNPRFRVKNAPVMYSPFMIIPVKTERQSGFLRPEIGFSDRLGTHINQPYFQVIDEENDITLYENFYSHRGLMQGLEFRSTPDLDDKALFRADWLKDKITAKTEEEEDSQFDDDGLIRPNENRYWLRGKYDATYFHNWQAKLDIDYVSDQNYLREFDSGYSGFQESRKQFMEHFGRDIDDNDDLIRENILSLTRNWAHTGLEARIEYDENLKYRNNNLDEKYNPTVQRFPEINYDLYRTDIPGTPLEIESDNQAVYFWREYGTRGTRVDVHPRLSLPWNTDFFTITPKAGWRETIYNIDRFENDPDKRDTDSKIQTRGIYDFSVDAYSQLFRVYDLFDAPNPETGDTNSSRWTKIKHELQPEVEYSYRPKENQEELPKFDSVDRLDPENELTYTLNNVFTRRRDSLVPSPEGNATQLQKSYLDFLRLKLEQSYDLREATRTEERDEYPRRPFSDGLVDITFNPGEWISLSNKSWYSPYLKEITEHEHMLRLHRDGLGSLWFGMDYRAVVDEYKRDWDEELEIMKLRAQVDFIPNWRVSGILRKDIAADQYLERGVTVTYLHQCFSLDFIMVRKDYENRYEVRVNLLNLGTIGG
jgi:LPS-assembly protein